MTNLERDGGTSGAGALGWRVNEPASEAGPAATLLGDPATLTAARVNVFAPTGTTGNAYASFVDGSGSVWVGLRAFSMPSGQWIQNTLTNVAYFWKEYVNGVVVSSSQSAWTLQDWAAGAGATSAEIGVMLGCGGEDFYVDSMVVANSQNSATYDFERAVVTPPPPPPPPPPPHLMAHLEWSTDGKTVKDGDELTIRYGQKLWMLGHAHLHSDAGFTWISGKGALTQEATRGRTKTFGGSFSPQYYAAYKVDPKERTIYQFIPAPYQGLQAESELVTVYVQSRIRAKIADRRLVEGQRLVVSGQIRPADRRVPVRLQRKVRGRWVNLATTRTAKKGLFTLGARARTPGTWTVRVKSGTTQSNIGAWTRSAKVAVKPYVPPKHSQSPQYPSTPTTPTTVSTPPPTKVTDTAPTPPDRPTPTGRVPGGAGQAATTSTPGIAS